MFSMMIDVFLLKVFVNVHVGFRMKLFVDYQRELSWLQIGDDDPFEQIDHVLNFDVNL